MDNVKRETVGKQNVYYLSTGQWDLFGNLDKCSDLIVEEVDERLFCIGWGSQCDAVPDLEIVTDLCNALVPPW